MGVVISPPCLYEYMLLLIVSLCIRHQIKQAEKTKFTAQHLKQIPNTVYRPKAMHKELVSWIDNYERILILFL